MFDASGNLKSASVEFEQNSEQRVFRTEALRKALNAVAGWGAETMSQVASKKQDLGPSSAVRVRSADQGLL